MMKKLLAICFVAILGLSCNSADKTLTIELAKELKSQEFTGKVVYITASECVDCMHKLLGILGRSQKNLGICNAKISDTPQDINDYMTQTGGLINWKRTDNSTLAHAVFEKTRSYKGCVIKMADGKIQSIINL